MSAKTEIVGPQPSSVGCRWLQEIRLLDRNHRASWEAFGSGHAEIKAEIHMEAGWCHLILEETGTKSTRQTMMTLDRAGALALGRHLLRLGRSKS